MMPRISVILPARGRVEALHRMLESLHVTAADVGQVEVVVRADNDDDAMVTYLRSRRLTFIVGPHLDGYITLATFINQAARLSRADLVLVVNDDAVFETQGWDQALIDVAAQHPDSIFDLGVDTVMNNENFVFPCTSRRVIDAIGVHDERLIYNDIWLRDVMRGFDRAIRVPQVTIRHDWKGMTHEQVQALDVVRDPVYARLYDRCVREAQGRVRTMLLAGVEAV